MIFWIDSYFYDNFDSFSEQLNKISNYLQIDLILQTFQVD
jgi:hypothetical protein